MALSEEEFRQGLVRLEKVANDAERNSLAFDLAETGRQEVLEPLARLIDREDLRNSRGTLVHALSYLDCSKHVAFLAGLVATGNYEVAHEALYILESVEVAPSEDVDRAVSTTEAALASVGLEDWRRELLEELAECYDI
jgi:hypothetical protein